MQRQLPVPSTAEAETDKEAVGKAGIVEKINSFCSLFQVHSPCKIEVSLKCTPGDAHWQEAAPVAVSSAEEGAGVDLLMTIQSASTPAALKRSAVYSTTSAPGRISRCSCGEGQIERRETKKR